MKKKSSNLSKKLFLNKEAVAQLNMNHAVDGRIITLHGMPCSVTDNTCLKAR